MQNECISYYDPGKGLNAVTSAAVSGCRFLKISGNRNATAGGPSEGNITVAHADAAGRVCGVSAYDAASGAQVGVLRGNTRVVPVQATNATIAAFAEVEVAANGMAVAKSSGVAVGYVITACAANGLAQVSLY